MKAEVFQEQAAAAQSHLGWILLAVGLLLVVALAVGAWWWLRKRRPARVDGDQKPLTSRQLLDIRRRFLNALPWRYRAAVVDFPTVVVMGPAGSGKSKLIDIEVDWRRQQNQFMPSYVDDKAPVQIYLGPDCVVQELSASLLEDGSQEARKALRSLWKASLGRYKRALVVVVVDARWFNKTLPDEVRRITQLLRGKINLLSEVCGGAVETRICLSRMEKLEGFAEFQELLDKHGAALELEVPRRGEEGRLAAALQPLEKYLTLGLTSLPVEAFERLEKFFSGGSEVMAGLSRFVAALWEGGTLSFPPKLSRVFLSSFDSERGSGALAIEPERKVQQLQKNYRWVHLRRCALLLVLGCLPVLAAYGNFYRLLQEARRRMRTIEQTVVRLEKKRLEAFGSVVETDSQLAMEAMARLWESTRYWPPLKDSFREDQAELRSRLASHIRKIYLKPYFEFCQSECQQCENAIPGCSAAHATKACKQQPREVGYQYQEWCRPEQMLYMEAVLHASRQDRLGRFILQSLDGKHQKRWDWARQALDLKVEVGGGQAQLDNWVDAVFEEMEEAVGDYVVASDRPWRASPQGGDEWAHWPYSGLDVESQLAPWEGHFERLSQWLADDGLDLEGWAALQQEREELQKLLDSTARYGSAREVLDMLNASQDNIIDEKALSGIRETLEALDWMREEHQVLQAVLDLERQADKALQGGERMSAAELLTQAEGLFVPSAGQETIEIALSRHFEFDPAKVSRQLLEKLLRQLDESDALAFARVKKGTPPGGQVATVSGTEGYEGDYAFAVATGAVPEGPVLDRVAFTTELKPLVDEFTERLAKAHLPQQEAAARESYVLGKVVDFSKLYGEGLFVTFRRYRFDANRATLLPRMAALVQPSSELVAMLRDVANRASVGPLEGNLYAPLRDAVAPFKPITQLMTPDKDGNYAALGQYILLVAQLHGELSGVKPAGEKGAEAKAAADKAEVDDKAAEQGEATGSPAVQLQDLLSPMARVSLAILLEEENSYLKRVDAWLDQQGILGEFREPFRMPFLVVRNVGREELEKVLREQWLAQRRTVLEPLLRRYPFDPEAQQELDPQELAVLRRKDGEFWQFVDQVLAPVIQERGKEWVPRGPLRNRLMLPPRMLSTLNHLSRLSRTLWDEEGKPLALALQVRPLPLPQAPSLGEFVTMSYFKCSEASAFGFNQSPTWQDFKLSWWDQRAASLGVELRSPTRSGKKYRTVEMPRSSWSCLRMLDLGTLTDEQNIVWGLPGADGDANAQTLEISFGLRGDPWAVFRGVPR